MATTQSFNGPDVYEQDVECRFQNELARGTVDGATFITATGARIAAFTEQPDDDELEAVRCVWCEGQGVIHDGDFDTYYGSDPCGNCNGTGISGKQKKGITRKEAWLDSLFFIDARRAELKDRDCCPDCGLGGGHDFGFECLMPYYIPPGGGRSSSSTTEPRVERGETG